MTLYICYEPEEIKSLRMHQSLEAMRTKFLEIQESFWSAGLLSRYAIENKLEFQYRVCEVLEEKINALPEHLRFDAGTCALMQNNLEQSGYQPIARQAKQDFNEGRFTEGRRLYADGSVATVESANPMGGLVLGINENGVLHEVYDEARKRCNLLLNRLKEKVQAM